MLVVSFVALAVLWPEPKLEGDAAGAALPVLRARSSSTIVCGAIGVFLLGVTMWAGLDGRADAAGELGLDVRLRDLLARVRGGERPARGHLQGVQPVARDRARAWRRREDRPRRRPARRRCRTRSGSAAGRPPSGSSPSPSWSWPPSDGDMPRATSRSRRSSTRPLTFIAMALYGIDRWIERGEAFSVYFNLFSRISVFERRGDEIGVRKPLSGADEARAAAGHRAAARRDDRLGQLRRRGRGRAWVEHRARHGRASSRRPRAVAGRRADGHVHDRPARGGPARLRLLQARHRRRPQRRRRLHASAAGQRVRPLARADRVRLRGGALLHAAAVPGAGDLVPARSDPLGKGDDSSGRRPGDRLHAASARTRPGTGRSAS